MPQASRSYWTKGPLGRRTWLTQGPLVKPTRRPLDLLERTEIQDPLADRSHWTHWTNGTTRTCRTTRTTRRRWTHRASRCSRASRSNWTNRRQADGALDPGTPRTNWLLTSRTCWACRTPRAPRS